MVVSSVRKYCGALALVGFIIGSGATRADAQSVDRPVEVGGQVSILRLNEFDINDAGIGAIAAWHLSRWQARIDVGDLLVRYNFAARRPNGEMSEGFVSHNLLTSFGLVWR